jgi:hypothetical protein
MECSNGNMLTNAVVPTALNKGPDGTTDDTSRKQAYHQYESAMAVQDMIPAAKLILLCGEL